METTLAWQRTIEQLNTENEDMRRTLEAQATEIALLKSHSTIPGGNNPLANFLTNIDEDDWVRPIDIVRLAAKNNIPTTKTKVTQTAKKLGWETRDAYIHEVRRCGRLIRKPTD